MPASVSRRLSRDGELGAEPEERRCKYLAAGDDDDFTLYSDAGEGLGYQQGRSATTHLSYRSQNRLSSLRIGAADGSYPGAPAGRDYEIDLVDTSQPQAVLLNGRPLPDSAWSYDPATATLSVHTGDLPTARTATITQIGGQPVQRAQSAASRSASTRPHRRPSTPAQAQR